MTEPVATAETPVIEECYPDRNAWLAARRTGLGSSDIPVILGLSPWSTPFRLWADKVGLAPPDPTETEYQQWGKKMEPLIAAAYAQETGREIVIGDPFRLLRTVERPWMLASLDYVLGPRGDQGPGVLEAKNVAAWKAEEWADEPPVMYQVQVQWQLLVTQYRWGSLAALIGGHRFLWADLVRRDALLALLLETAEAFWDRVQREDPPPVDGSDVTKEVLARLYPRAEPGKVIVLPVDATTWDAMAVEAAAEVKRWKAVEQEAKNLLRAALGDAEVGVLPGGVAWTAKFVQKRAYEVAATEYRDLRRRMEQPKLGGRTAPPAAIA